MEKLGKASAAITIMASTEGCSSRARRVPTIPASLYRSLTAHPHSPGRRRSRGQAGWD
jgi:hypothetical protein